jgi:hypothetical protein
LHAGNTSQSGLRWLFGVYPFRQLMIVSHAFRQFAFFEQWGQFTP